MKIKDFVVGKKYRKIKGIMYAVEVMPCISNDGIRARLLKENGHTYVVEVNPEHWEPVEDEMEDLKYGDWVIDEEDIGEELPLKYSYIGRTPDGRFITACYNGDEILPYGDMECRVWNRTKFVKKPEIPQKSPVVELTLQDIADKMGIEVENIRIKE